MSKSSISKYYYHYYVIFILFLSLISATYGVSSVNFHATKTGNIFALCASITLYCAIILYFFFLYRKQQWIIPRSWKNFQKRPLLYCLIIFPICFIPVFWLNFSQLFPMFYTKVSGIKSVEILAAHTKEHSFKGNTTYCLSNKYSCLPIFKINKDEFERYKNKKVVLQITSQKSSLGTIVYSIDHIRISEKNH